MMPDSTDRNLPVTVAFHELIGKAHETDAKEQEAKWAAQRKAEQELFLLHNPGRMTASQAFLPNEEENERLKSQIDQELKVQAAAKRAAQEKADAPVTGEFPPPPISV